MSSIPPYGNPPQQYQGQPQFQQQAPQPARHPSQPPASAQGGFFKTLFDFTFTRFITRRAIGVIWGIVLAFYGVGTILYVTVAFISDTTLGLIALIVAPIVALLGLVAWRLILEFLAVQFRQADLLEQLVQK